MPGIQLDAHKGALLLVILSLRWASYQKLADPFTHSGFSTFASSYHFRQSAA
jgi:hypothetical protein